VAPGALKTRLVDEVLAAGPEKVGAAFFAKNKKWAKKAPRRSNLARASAFTSLRRRATESPENSSARNGTRGERCTSTGTNWRRATSIVCAASCRKIGEEVELSGRFLSKRCRAIVTCGLSGCRTRLAGLARRESLTNVGYLD
jgi:hypothetical protein